MDVQASKGLSWEGDWRNMGKTINAGASRLWMYGMGRGKVDMHGGL